MRYYPSVGGPGEEGVKLQVDEKRHGLFIPVVSIKGIKNVRTQLKLTKSDNKSPFPVMINKNFLCLLSVFKIQLFVRFSALYYRGSSCCLKIKHFWSVSLFHDCLGPHSWKIHLVLLCSNWLSYAWRVNCWKSRMDRRNVPFFERKCLIFINKVTCLSWKKLPLLTACWFKMTFCAISCCCCLQTKESNLFVVYISITTKRLRKRLMWQTTLILMA